MNKCIWLEDAVKIVPVHLLRVLYPGPHRFSLLSRATFLVQKGVYKSYRGLKLAEKVYGGLTLANQHIDFTNKLLLQVERCK